MRKIAIIGASYLQVPLINKAKEMGLETHVFAWAANDVGESIADHFYPISIVEKEAILEKCKEIQIDGICTIASDLAVVTVNYVAEKMGLAGNGEECTHLATNKHNMRAVFEKNGDPSPRSIMVHQMEDLDEALTFPVIVKPLDRSGSRGIFKVLNRDDLPVAIDKAKEQGFIKEALVEEYVEGQEYSIECVSYNGIHNFLAMTYKFTTGSPNFVETGHLQPAGVDDALLERVRKVVFHALDSLKIRNGASHSEIKIDKNKNIKIIEIGARMGGDFIGSDLVQLSTGIDFVKAVVDIALGNKPDLTPAGKKFVAGVHFICTDKDLEVYNRLMEEHPEFVVAKDIPQSIEGKITDSASRFGYFIMKADSAESLRAYLPEEKG